MKRLKKEKHMLLNGQIKDLKNTNPTFTKKRITITTIVALLLIILIILIEKACIYNKDNSVYKNKYYENFYRHIEYMDSILMTEIVDFEFDKIYVASITEIYLSEEYFTDKLNTYSLVDIPVLNSGNHNRLLFIRDNVIVYDFVYPMFEIYFADEVTWITSEDSIKVLLKQDNMIKLGIQ